MAEPLPVYPDLLLKATHIADDLKEHPSLVLGGLIRVWLYAHANGEAGGDGVTVRGMTVEKIDRYAGVDGLAAEMADRGWINACDDGIVFPRLKRFEVVTRKAARGAKKERPQPKRSGYTEAFEAFWAAYVAAEGDRGPKLDAFAVWQKIDITDETLAAILAAVRREVESGWSRFNRHNPHARRWLRQRMWEDDPPKPSAAPPKAPGGPQPADRGPDDLAARVAAKAREIGRQGR